VRAAGAGHVLLRTDRDWLPELARHLTTRRRGAARSGAVRV
jgi:V8-like Glu-specific endopeptidase